MSVDITPLVGRLQRSLSGPGADQFPDAGPIEWASRLADAFWYAKLNGYFLDYKVDTTTDPYVIVNIAGGDELSDELQTVIVLYAAITAIEATMMFMLSLTNYKAGTAQAENQRSSLLLKSLLAAKLDELAALKDQILLGNGQTTVAFIDLVCARGYAIQSGYTDWYN